MMREERVNVHFGPINIHVVPPEPDSLLFDIYPTFDLGLTTPKLKGLTVAYKLRDDKGFKLKLQGKSRRGNLVDFGAETLEATSSDPAILAVSVDTTGLITVQPVGPLGTAQVQVTVPDVDTDTEGNQPLSGQFDVEVVSGIASSIVFEPSETFDVVIPADTTPGGGGADTVTGG